MSICFRGFRRGEDLGAEGPASPAGRGRHRSLRLQDRLPEDRGRGALSAHGATLCDGSERGHLPGSFSCLQPAGALGLGGPIEAGHPGHRDCRTLPPLFPGHAAHDGRMCAGLHHQLPGVGTAWPNAHPGGLCGAHQDRHGLPGGTGDHLLADPADQPRSGAFSGGRSGGLWNRPFGPVAAGPACVRQL